MVINPIIGFYIPIIRIPIKRWDDHPQYNELIDPGSYVDSFFVGDLLDIHVSWPCKIALSKREAVVRFVTCFNSKEWCFFYRQDM